MKDREMKKAINEFLQQSNFIEREYGDVALKDAKRAWKFAYENMGLNMNIDYVVEIHRLLMRRLRPDIAGKIRACDVWIGGHRVPFISEKLIQADILMKVLFEMYIHGDFDKELKAKQIHIAFEAIHPFEDGNGRVGRILYNIHRLKMGLPIHVIHEGDEQFEYRQWFRK